MDRAMASAAYSLPRKTFDRDVLSGDPVKAPCKAAPDLEFVAEPDEIEDLDWHFVTVDILDMYNLFDIDDRLTLSGESDADAVARWASVRTWMDGMGGPEAALSACPVIVKLNGESLEPLDGWHRCVVAWLDYGVREVNAMVGSPRPEPGLSL